MTKTWQELQATIPWDALQDEPAPAVPAVAQHAPAVPSLTAEQRRQIALGFAAALLAVGVVLFALGRASAVTERPAPLVTVAPAEVQVVTRTPGPSVVLYRDVLAATPDAVRWHNYTLLCRGKVYEFAGLDALRTWQAQSAYEAADCKCFLPRFENAGYRECNKE